MRIALCLFGLTGGNSDVGGQGKKINPKNGFYHYNKNLLSQYEVDVFIHSWSVEFEKQIVDLYKPKGYKIESQNEFKKISLEAFGFKSINDLRAHEPYKTPFKKLSDKDAYNKFDSLLWRSYSRWYSTKKSIDLKKDYELINNIKYDFVISSRFDIALLTKIDFKNLDSSKFYASKRHNRDDIKRALYDFIFFSNTDTMNDFSLLIDRFEKYTFRPTWAVKEHIDFIGVEIEECLKYDEDYKLLRWNQNYMSSDFDMYYFLRHTLKTIKSKWLKN